MKCFKKCPICGRTEEMTGEVTKILQMMTEMLSTTGVLPANAEPAATGMVSPCPECKQTEGKLAAMTALDISDMPVRTGEERQN